MDHMSTDEKINLLLQMVKELSDDVKGVKQDTMNLKSDVTTLKSDVSTLKNDVKEMDQRLEKVEFSLKVFVEETHEYKRRVQRLETHVGL